MNKTEFLLRLKLQKGLSYLKILQVMQQMPPDEDVDHEWLNCLELPDEILAAMIFRDHQMIIPHGNDCLLPYDNAYFIGAPENIEKFSQGMAESSTRHIKKAIVIGAGRTGTALAPMLEADGISVKVIDLDPEQCRHISSKLKKSIVLCGDGADIDLLMQEGVSEADVVICTTKDERLNLLVALLARHLGAKKTIVRVVRGEYADLMTQVGVDIALSVRLLAAGEVLRDRKSTRLNSSHT